ncbi:MULTISPECIES: CDP-glycerol glycerophosphotransferase family protein [Microbacterium]|uniref:Glycosyl/glycerophosphate transferase n=1 Tax=Microbacterium hominis TaxID=162426 RepID=A0A2K9DTZ7_9MICO|nr:MULTISPECIES: CDP-glycerol glycerophosphotransferase family protein [Microbacterium]AUG29344.1 glycosyl/glycerophosphate transferase [Microbacterium hominis]
MTITASIRHAEAGPELVLQGEGKLPDAAVLAGRRARVDGSPAADGTRGWTAALPLRSARGGERELPLPTGDYRLRLDGADAGEVAAASIADTMTSTMRVALRDGTLTVRPPIDAAYDSAEAQAALERRYATRPGGELENAVFFESFYGRIAGCNPRAIDRELARAAPGVIRYWSVVDLSVAVPDGAVAVVEGSPQWWRARASARLLVVNDWLRRRYVRRPGQRVLQTWHGTPLKRLALHRPGFDLRRMLAVVREGRRWDVLLAQNEYGARTLRAAYAFLRRPIWVEGYPRNDELSAGTGSRQQEIRSLLGIGAEEHVLLYAPTWRDDREQIVDFLDLPAFAEATGSVVLVRGHSRTLLPGVDLTVDAPGPRVIDVTGHSDTSELLMIADALITDYSSVMFDFTATGKPIFFFTPDLEHYRGRLRGFYFDLAAHAPGPLATTQEELTRLVADETVPERFAGRYATWRARVNARDDGRAAERVVARILDQRFVDRD